MAPTIPVLTISPAEQRVLSLLQQGHSNRQMAALLQLSPRTVESHLASMFDKTGCRNRAQLILWSLQRQGIAPPSVPAWN